MFLFGGHGGLEGNLTPNSPNTPNYGHDSRNPNQNAKIIWYFFDMQVRKHYLKQVEVHLCYRTFALTVVLLDVDTLTFMHRIGGIDAETSTGSS